MDRQIEVKIESLSPRGYGRGKWVNGRGNEILLDVPFAIPGDRVLVERRSKKKGAYQCRILEILESSEQRIEPKCTHFGSCGGCVWQQVTGKRQREWKAQRIEELFKPYLDEKSQIQPLISKGGDWRYRNKMEFTFSSDRKGEQFLGLILQGSRGKVFNLTECHLVNPWMAETLKTVRDWWKESGLEAYKPTPNTGALQTLTLREGLRTGDRLVMLTVSGKPEEALNKEQIRSFQETIVKSSTPSQGSLSVFLRIHQAIKGKPSEMYEMLLSGEEFILERLQLKRELEFQISPSAFFQPNPDQAEVLYTKAVELAGIDANSVVYDLYCGTGTLGICVALEAKEVIGIELSPESALDGRENAKRNGIENLTIHTGDVAKVLTDLKEHTPDVVIVDPPRPGLGPDAIEQVAALFAPRIVYISCNPTTQAIDTEILLSKGYKIETIQPVDQFPQTAHCENIVVFTSRGRQP